MKNVNKNKTGWLLCTALSWSALLFVPGALMGQATKQSRQVEAFNGVALSFSGNVQITQAAQQQVVIEADKDVLDIIITEVNGNTLVIKTKNGQWRDLGDVNVMISMPDITSLSVSGSGDIRSETALKTPEIKVNVSGSGSIYLQQLESPNVEAEITGSGDIKLAGNSTDQSRLKTIITGSGSYKGEGLVVGEAHVTITGSGSATVNVLKELDTNITGSGSVMYKGNPLVNANATGSGRTRALN